MKKLLLTGLLVLSTMTFAAKITTTGKSWEKIEKENKVPGQESSIMDFNWLDKNNDTYNFQITKLDFKKNNDFYLKVFYENKPENGLPLVSDFNDIDNYIGQDGKKHPKLYFGFDEKTKKVVITDKNGNIKNVLEYYPAG